MDGIGAFKSQLQPDNRPKFRAADAETLLVADGFSCRSQITAGTGRRALHTAEALSLGLQPIA